MATQKWKDEHQEEMRAYRRKYYDSHKDTEIARIKQRKKDISEFILDLKSSLICPCGEDDIDCLDFHHVDPSEKETTIAAMVVRGWGKRRILQEIEKCQVLCSNCHRKLHAKLRGIR